MAIPTVNVTVQVNDSAGQPVEGAHVVAKLRTTEVYQGLVVPAVVDAETGGDGSCILSLFPNELGTEGSDYRFRIINPVTGKSDVIYGVVPNADCLLTDIADLPPYEKRSISVLMQSDIDQNAEDISTNAAAIQAEASSRASGDQVNAGAIVAEATARTTHEADVSNPHGVTKTQVGLGNVLDAEQIPATEKAAANGVATLDGNAKVPVSQIPDTVVGAMDYKGTFDPASGYPASPEKGDYYVASADGTVDTTDYAQGDWAAYNGSTWDKIDNTEALATTDAPGVVELATAAEAIAHTDGDKAVTPAGLLDIYTKLQGILTDVWLFDSLRFLNDQMNQLISGSMVGSEGAWKIIDVTTVTPDTIQITSRDYGDITLIYNSTFTSGTSYGNNSVLRESFSAVIIGDSGAAYLCPVVQYGSGETTLRYADIHPKYGNVTSDFTTSNTYTIIICQEATGDKTTGTQTRTEYFLGSDIDTVAEIYAALNAPTFDTVISPALDTANWTEGGTASIADGVASLPTASDHIQTAIPSEFQGRQGRKLLVKIVVDSITTGSLFAYTFYWDAADSDATNNKTSTVTTAGTHYLWMETDSDSVLYGIRTGDGTDAVISEFEVVASSEDTPLTNIAPDPYFEHDGTDGGWELSNDMTIVDGQAICETTTVSSAVYENPVAEDVKFLAVVDVDSITGTPFLRNNRSISGVVDVELSEGINYIICDEATGGEANWIGVLCGAGEGIVINSFHIYEIEDIRAAINPGYFDGPTWTSQLLGDVTTSLNRIIVKLNRSRSGAPSSVHVLDATGQWVQCAYDSAGQATNTALTYVYGSTNNTVLVNTTDTYATLGYASESEMLANSAVKVVYTHAALPVRPCANPSDAVVLGSFVFQSNSKDYAAFVSALIHTVPVGVSYDNLALTQYQLEPSNRQLEATISHATSGMSDGASAPNGVKVWYGGVDNGSTWDLVLWGKELVYDSTATDWGDDGEIPVGDYVTTMTDDNGNVVICGCWKVDTGVTSPLGLGA